MRYSFFLRPLLLAGIMLLHLPGIPIAAVPAGPRAGFGHLPPGGGSFDLQHRVDLEVENLQLATNFVVATVVTGRVVPDQIALVVQRETPLTESSAAAPESPLSGGTNAARARFEQSRARMAAMRARLAGDHLDPSRLAWFPFTNRLPIDFGPGDGPRKVWIAGRWGTSGKVYASATTIVVDHRPPQIVITNPASAFTSQPMIQLQGFSVEPLQSLKYEVINFKGRFPDNQGYVNHQQYDLALSGFTTNYFTCHDVDLAIGTNTIILSTQDFAGNWGTNTYTWVHSLVGDTTPPTIDLAWPMTGIRMPAPEFMAHGTTDDSTARFEALISTGTSTNITEGSADNGHFLIEGLPLATGKNDLSIIATDAAGNSSSTNLVLYGVPGSLTMDPVPPERLWDRTITVTGRVSPVDHLVWINGVQAQVRPDGTWIARDIPLGGLEGTETFHMTSMPPRKQPVSTALPRRRSTSGSDAQELLSVSALLGNSAAVLNPGKPVCGAFSLHLSNPALRSFVLLSSTNLVDWRPILTNSAPVETFSYARTNSLDKPCEFFRVQPLP